MYLVVEWIIIAAPWSKGLHIIGAAVLSTIRGIPSFLPISATSLIGKTCNFGFGNVSAKYARVLSSVAFAKSLGSLGSTKRTSIPISLKVLLNWFHVPPYKSVDETILSPARAIFCMAYAVAVCPDDTAKAAAPPSNAATPVSYTHLTLPTICSV